MTKHSTFELVFFLGLLLGSLVVTFFLFQPFFTALAVAAIFAVLLYPLHLRIRRFIHNETLAALLSTLCAIVLIAAPLSVIGTLLFQEARAMSVLLNTNGGWETARTLIQPFEGIAQHIFPGVSFELQAVVKEVVSWITRNVGGAFLGTTQFVVAFFAGLVSFFYFLKDGHRFLENIIAFSPLSDNYDKIILLKLKNAIHSIVQGTLLIALIQGLLTALGFFIFGVPNPMLWGTLSAIAAVLPAIGPSLIVAPAVLYLYFVGSFSAAIGLAVWGMVVVGLIDNILLPKIMGSRARVHPLLVLISVLGGLHLFGPSGFLLGPLILSFMYAIGEIYLDIFKKNLEDAREGATPQSGD